MGADGRVSIPAFICVLCPVAEPRRVIGKVRTKMQRMQQRKSADEDQPNRVETSFGESRQGQSLAGMHLLYRAGDLSSAAKVVKPRREFPVPFSVAALCTPRNRLCMMMLPPLVRWVWRLESIDLSLLSYFLPRLHPRRSRSRRFPPRHGGFPSARRPPARALHALSLDPATSTTATGRARP